jgi:hypothetical protein
LKFKLDENIGRRGLELLKASGHDAMTVWDQGLHGVIDQKLFEICSAEGRTLVTLDRDFGQVPRFPPEKSAGIVILEVGPRANPPRNRREAARFPGGPGKPFRRWRVDRRTGTGKDSSPEWRGMTAIMWTSVRSAMLGANSVFRTGALTRFELLPPNW